MLLLIPLTFVSSLKTGSLVVLTAPFLRLLSFYNHFLSTILYNVNIPNFHQVSNLFCFVISFSSISLCQYIYWHSTLRTKNRLFCGLLFVSSIALRQLPHFFPMESHLLAEKLEDQFQHNPADYFSEHPQVQHSPNQKKLQINAIYIFLYHSWSLVLFSFLPMPPQKYPNNLKLGMPFFSCCLSREIH